MIRHLRQCERKKWDFEGMRNEMWDENGTPKAPEAR